MDVARREAIRRAWMEGASPRELAERFGLGERYARKGCAKGWEAGPGSGRPRLDPAEAVARKRRRWREWSAKNRPAIRARARRARVRLLWSQGFTGPELAKLLEMPRSTIAGYVRDMPRRRSFADERHASWPLPRRRLARPEMAPRIFRFAPRVPADRLPGSVQPRGSEHGRALLDEAAVLEMRRLRAEGSTVVELAKRWGVSAGAAGYAIRGVTWGHLAGAIPSPAPKKGGRG